MAFALNYLSSHKHAKLTFSITLMYLQIANLKLVMYLHSHFTKYPCQVIKY